MSGVVMSLDEEEDEAGLLTLEDDDDDEGYAYDLGSKSKMRRRIGKAKAKSKFGKKIRPYTTTTIRAGSVGHLLHTLLICCVFFGLVFDTL